MIQLSRTLLLACGAVIGGSALSAAVIVTAGPNLSLVEGTAFNGTLGTFTDTDASLTVSDFTSTINWGDGTTSAAAISAGNGFFTITGTHTYADENPTPFITTLNVSDIDGSSGSGTVATAVADAPLTLISSGSSFSFMAGVPVSVTFGSFGDANPFGTAADFAATINWGDGTTSLATIFAIQNGFDILGGHTYANPGDFLASVSILDDGGSQLAFQTEAVGAVPEPGSLGMIAIGLGSVAAMARRRRRRVQRGTAASNELESVRCEFSSFEALPLAAVRLVRSSLVSSRRRRRVAGQWRPV